MSRHCFPLFATAVLLLAMSAFADDTKAPAKLPSEKMTPQTRMLVIRDLTAERVFARRLFPIGEKGLQIKNGVVTPSDAAGCPIGRGTWSWRPGRATGWSFPTCIVKDNSIVSRDQWRTEEAREVVSAHPGGHGGTMSTVGGAPKSLEAKGSQVTLEFDKYVPELTGDQIRDMLSPVFDFKALNQAEAYEKTLPPKVQEAIKNHKVLVGMDRDMVIYAKGRPPRKIRDKDDKGQDYEEWIYGNPPEEVDFVRFQGEVVARLEIMTVDGEKIVRTEKEVDLKAADTEVAQKKPERPANAPTLRRPGEQQEYPQDNPTRPATPYPAPGTTGPDPDPGNAAAFDGRTVMMCSQFGAPSPRRLYTVKVRIALGQINTTVGDFPGNSAKIIEYARRAKSAGVDLILFPELSVCGYPPRDLVERSWFVERNRQTAESIAAGDARALPSSAAWSLRPIPLPASRC